MYTLPARGVVGADPAGRALGSESSVAALPGELGRAMAAERAPVRAPRSPALGAPAGSAGQDPRASALPVIRGEAARSFLGEEGASCSTRGSRETSSRSLKTAAERHACGTVH